MVVLNTANYRHKSNYGANQRLNVRIRIKPRTSILSIEVLDKTKLIK